MLGGASDSLSVLCEDAVAEVVLGGVGGVVVMFGWEGGIVVVLGRVVQCAEVSLNPNVVMQAQGSVDSTGIRNASWRRPR